MNSPNGFVFDTALISWVAYRRPLKQIRPAFQCPSFLPFQHGDKQPTQLTDFPRRHTTKRHRVRMPGCRQPERYRSLTDAHNARISGRKQRKIWRSEELLRDFLAIRIWTMNTPFIRTRKPGFRRRMETITEDAEEFPQDNQDECLGYRMVEALNEISLEGAESVSGILESISEEDSAVGVDLGGHPEYEPRYALIYIHGFDYNELELNKAKAMRLGRRRANLATCFVRSGRRYPPSPKMRIVHVAPSSPQGRDRTMVFSIEPSLRRAPGHRFAAATYPPGLDDSAWSMEGKRLKAEIEASSMGDRYGIRNSHYSRQDRTNTEGQQEQTKVEKEEETSPISVIELEDNVLVSACLFFARVDSSVGTSRAGSAERVGLIERPQATGRRSFKPAFNSKKNSQSKRNEGVKLATIRYNEQMGAYRRSPLDHGLRSDSVISRNQTGLCANSSSIPTTPLARTVTPLWPSLVLSFKFLAASGGASARGRSRLRSPLFWASRVVLVCFLRKRSVTHLLVCPFSLPIHVHTSARMVGRGPLLLSVSLEAETLKTLPV
ncbi:hypothetical protein FA13DRAFT_1720699 [Coprinellus micaceus]|uniref:Uncharacterized protein n=1 Tax=Coprinellus micaceus TaxID=71717 RepID=A0A4Y7S786_COPMI|nr:hypothetical protein FA13DRAFT_1720699 [Coprinellus micaceus]